MCGRWGIAEPVLEIRIYIGLIKRFMPAPDGVLLQVSTSAWKTGRCGLVEGSPSGT